MTRIIDNDNFWTMDEDELDACIKAFRHNGWWWYSTSDYFDCQREYDLFRTAYMDYVEDYVPEGETPMSLEYFYWDLVACGMGENN